MSTNYGSKRLVVGAHYGMRDWLSQRVTAALMALFTLVLLVQLLLPGPLGYDRWAGIFSRSLRFRSSTRTTPCLSETRMTASSGPPIHR